MPLISKVDEHLLDPLSEKMSQKLLSCSDGKHIDKFKLKEFAFTRAKKAILEKHPDWFVDKKMDKESITRLISFNVRLDYNEDLQAIVDEFFVFCKEEQKENSEFTTKVEKQEEVQRTIFSREIPETHKDKDIDKPVASGRRTKLHMACEEGNFEEVVRLVEKCGAKVNIRDASNWTPKERASLNNKSENHAKIILYLDNFS